MGSGSFALVAFVHNVQSISSAKMRSILLGECLFLFGLLCQSSKIRKQRTSCVSKLFAFDDYCAHLFVGKKVVHNFIFGVEVDTTLDAEECFGEQDFLSETFFLYDAFGELYTCGG